MILLSSQPPPWVYLPEPWNDIISYAFLGFTILALLYCLFGGIVYYVAQVKQGNGLTVALGIFESVIGIGVFMYVCVAWTTFVLLTLLGIPLMVFTDEHASLGTFAVMWSATLPAVALAVWLFIKRDSIDGMIDRWQARHFPGLTVAN